MMIYLYAFLIGGLICMAGQLLMDLTKLTPAADFGTVCVSGSGVGRSGLVS